MLSFLYFCHCYFLFFETIIFMRDFTILILLDYLILNRNITTISFIYFKNNFKFPQSRYLVQSEYVISFGPFDLSPFPILDQFCVNRTVEESRKFDSVDEMKKAVKAKMSSKSFEFCCVLRLITFKKRF